MGSNLTMEDRWEGTGPCRWRMDGRGRQAHQEWRAGSVTTEGRQERTARQIMQGSREGAGACTPRMELVWRGREQGMGQKVDHGVQACGSMAAQ